MLVYLDDIIVFSESFEDAIRRLSAVFDRLRKAGLKLKPSKCHLFQKRVHYLGHVVSEHGISTDPSKIEKVKNWPTPKNQTDVRSFLGLASYYRKFIKGFAEIARPMQKCFSGPLIDCEQAFQILKERLVTSPILAYPNNKDPFILDTDASDFGIGAVLSQVQDGEEKVLAYASRALGKAERNYCVTRKELLAGVDFMMEFRQYLYGRIFLWRTDHSALRWISNFKNAEGQLARWISTLAEFNYEVEHRPGKKHINADSMSRMPCHECHVTNVVGKRVAMNFFQGRGGNG